MSYLLDTSVISELVSARPNPTVIRWLEEIDPEGVFLSVITIGELKRGIERLSPSKGRRELDDWLSGDLLVRFADRIIPIDGVVAQIWGELVARMEAIGQPMPAIDCLLAASAAHAGLTLVTRNVRDFEATGVRLLNPWEAPGARKA